MELFIISFLFLVISLIVCYHASRIRITKNEQQEQYEKKLKEEVHTLQKDRNDLINSQIRTKEELNRELLQFQEYRKKELDEDLQKQKEIIKLKLQKANDQTSQEIESIHNDLNNIRQSAKQQKQQISDEIEKMRSYLSAGVEARLREKEKEDKLNFYKLSISEADLSDIEILERIKPSLRKPVLLSKLIWTQYFQKQMTDLCDRVLGKNRVSGIYKITNILTQESYIGQSVNIAERWKQHCKCGLGIQASSTNALYNSMQKDGVWNFTFELLEECPKELLNEKERFWIEMYQSNKFGLNTMKGNRT